MKYFGEWISCIEVAPGPEAVLSSKHRTGPALSVPPTAWHAFLATLATLTR